MFQISQNIRNYIGRQREDIECVRMYVKECAKERELVQHRKEKKQKRDRKRETRGSIERASERDNI